MSENKSSKKTVIGVAMAAVIIGSVIAMLAPALVAKDVPSGKVGIYYLVPDNSSVPEGYCHSTNVELRVNTTGAIRGGKVTLTFDRSCVNITGITFNTAVWNDPNANKFNSLPDKTVILYGATSERPSGDYLVGDLVLHCNSSSSCCACNVSIIETTTVSNETGNYYLPVDVSADNGTFICGKPLVINKTVKDPNTGNWVDGPITLGPDWLNKNITFNITVTAACEDLSNVVVNDTMDSSLKYKNASDTPDSSTDHTANWTIGPLSAGSSKTILFNATIVAYGTDDNIAKTSGTVDKIGGVDVEADDTVTITTNPPALIDVNKTVWSKPKGDPDYNNGTWVNVAQGAKIGEIYRFNCTIHNSGSYDLTNITFNDTLSGSLEYAGNATMVTPDGITRSIDITGDGTDYEVNDFLQDPLTLKPCQRIYIEFDAKVINYGNDSNVQWAKGQEPGGMWIYDHDDAWINTTKPDLIVSDITINYDASKVKNKAIGPLPPGTKTQCNNLSADISEQNGVDVVFPFNVKFEVNGAELNCSPVQVPAGMAGGSTQTVYCNCSFYPIAGQKYNISVTVDSGDAIRESNENNNIMWRNVTAQWIGYKGDGWQDGRNITTLQCHDQGTINITYSAGDSKYLSKWSYPHWTTYTVNWTASDLPIPPTETCIKKARLYVYYTWDSTPGRNASDYFIMRFNGYEVPRDKVYTDAKEAGASYNWGMVAYNVTGVFSIGGNTANLTNTYPGGGKVSMEGMFLVVVYNNSAEPERIIMMNEGLDALCANDEYGISTEEATTYAPFTCPAIPLDRIGKATLATVTVDAGGYGAPGMPNMQALYFNGHLLGKGLDIWPVAYSIPTVNETDVRHFLTATNNTAAIQSYKPAGYTRGDYFEASLAFLILEKGKPQISVDVPPDCIAQGEQFTVNVTVDPRGTSIFGVEYEISFDPTVIHAEWQNEGDFLSQDGASTNVYINTIDNDAGKVAFAVTRTGTTTGVTTPGVLAKIHFTATKLGANTSLTFTKVKVSDPDAHSLYTESVNGTVQVCENMPPIAIGRSMFRFNNVGTKYMSKTYFNASDSHDNDGNITYYRWAFGDGNYGTGETVEYVYGSWRWNSNSYEPFNVILTVEDDGTPVLDNSTSFPVNVYIAGDANGDGIVDIFDGVIVGLEWDNTADFNGKYYWYNNERGDRADLNNDKVVDIYDGVIVGANWDHTAY